MIICDLRDWIAISISPLLFPISDRVPNAAIESLPAPLGNDPDFLRACFENAVIVVFRSPFTIPIGQELWFSGKENGVCLRFGIKNRSIPVI